MKEPVYYSIVFNDEQLAYLAKSKYKVDRMKILTTLIRNAVTEDTTIEMKGFATTLHIGQVLMSEVELSNRLGNNKKTISKVLDKMHQLGIITSDQNNRTSVHLLHCISAWYVDGRLISNPNYIDMKQRHKDFLASGNLAHEQLADCSKHSEEKGTTDAKSQNTGNLPTSATEPIKEVAQPETNSSFPKFEGGVSPTGGQVSEAKLSETTIVSESKEANAEGSADTVRTKHSESGENIHSSESNHDTTDGKPATSKDGEPQHSELDSVQPTIGNLFEQRNNARRTLSNCSEV